MNKENFNIKIDREIEKRFAVYGGDYIVEFKARRTQSEKYERFVEILSQEIEQDSLVWLNDWDEGYTDFILIGVYDIEELVDTFKRYNNDN